MPGPLDSLFFILSFMCSPLLYKPMSSEMTIEAPIKLGAWKGLGQNYT